MLKQASKLYFVENGKASEWDFKAQADGSESVLCFAPTPEKALELADAYDRGEIGIDNVCYNGEFYAALS